MFNFVESDEDVKQRQAWGSIRLTGLRKRGRYRAKCGITFGTGVMWPLNKEAGMGPAASVLAPANDVIRQVRQPACQGFRTRGKRQTAGSNQNYPQELEKLGSGFLFLNGTLLHYRNLLLQQFDRRFIHIGKAEGLLVFGIRLTSEN